MKYDISPRGGGKTTRMIEKLRANSKHILLVMDQREKDRLKHEYKDVAEQVFTFDEWMRKQNRTQIETISVDNTDLILQDILRHRIDTLTFSEAE